TIVNCNNPFNAPPNFLSNFFPGGNGFGAFGAGQPGVFAPSVANQQQQQEQAISVAPGAAAPAAGAAPAVSVAIPSIPLPAQGRVAFTGANVIRWSIAALSLMAVGALLVMHSRRRRPGVTT